MDAVNTTQASESTQNPALIYCTDFSMQDGSKRRPLIERVPECRPAEIRDYELFDGAPIFRIHESAMSGGPVNRCGCCYGDIAAKLFRCAVEDWLMYFEFLQLSRGWTGPNGEIEISNVWLYHHRREDATRIAGEGTSVHDALCAAAHALADAQGIPH